MTNSLTEQGFLELQRTLKSVLERFHSSVIEQCEGVLIPFNGGFIQISREVVPPKVSDRVLIERLKKILDGASERAIEWRTVSTTQEQYENYRDWCHRQVWDLFWETANQISVSVDYCSPDTSYEEDMRARLNSYGDIDWLIDIRESL